jgi:hypothetical protein
MSTNASTTLAALASLSDYSTFPGPDPVTGLPVFDLTPRRITAGVVVAQWVARAWLTPRGRIRSAPSRGVDLLDLVNATLDAATVENWRVSLIIEAQKTPFVSSCALSLTLANRTTAVDSRLVLIDGQVYGLGVNLSAAGQVIVALPQATG